MMDSIVTGFRREYWEHKHIIVGLPLLLGALSIVGFIVAVLAMTYYQGDEQKLLLAEDGDIFSFEFIGFYIGAAWLAGIYYLLSCLYSDRKDKSILFWKSLPVSETQNVLTKLLFACLGFVAIAIVIAWLTSIVLLMLFFGANSLGAGEIAQDAGLEFSVTKFLIWPPVSMIFGLLWGAPVFTYVLMVSAGARRSPFLLLVVPLLVLPILEGTLFGTNHLIGFFGEHLPFGVLEAIASSADMGSFLQYYFIDRGISLLIGLALAALFTVLAIWFRNSRFEL